MIEWTFSTHTQNVLSTANTLAIDGADTPLDQDLSLSAVVDSWPEHFDLLYKAANRNRQAQFEVDRTKDPSPHCDPVRTGLSAPKSRAPASAAAADGRADGKAKPRNKRGPNSRSGSAGDSWRHDKKARQAPSEASDDDDPSGDEGNASGPCFACYKMGHRPTDPACLRGPKSSKPWATKAPKDATEDWRAQCKKWRARERNIRLYGAAHARARG